MGIVYVMTNPAMPDLVKIGKTTNTLEQRVRDLYTTGVPFPFDVHYAGEVENADAVESLLHKAFGDHRTNPRREFFRIAPEKVVAAIQLANPKDVTPTSKEYESAEEEQAAEKEKQRRGRLRLDKIGIPEGAELVLSRGDSISATVTSNGRVLFNGQTLSLSASAKQALESIGMYGEVSGSVYWTYKGETLEERRWRLEEEELGEQD